jgi:protein-tyrosine phosphatase
MSFAHHLISCLVRQAGVANYFVKSFVYKRIAVLDNPTSATDFLSLADSIVDFIVTGLCHGSVLVHCHHGVSRSTTAVLFYLMRYVNNSMVAHGI